MRKFLVLAVTAVILSACQGKTVTIIRAPDSCLKEPALELPDWPLDTFCRYSGIVGPLNAPHSCADQEGRIWLSKFANCPWGLEQLADLTIAPGEFIISRTSGGFAIASLEHLMWERGSCVHYHSVPVASMSVEPTNLNPPRLDAPFTGWGFDPSNPAEEHPWLHKNPEDDRIISMDPSAWHMGNPPNVRLDVGVGDPPSSLPDNIDVHGADPTEGPATLLGAFPTFAPAHSIRFFGADEKNAVMVIHDDGRVVYMGREIGTDPEVFSALKELKNTQLLRCPGGYPYLVPLKDDPTQKSFPRDPKTGGLMPGVDADSSRIISGPTFTIPNLDPALPGVPEGQMNFNGVDNREIFRLTYSGCFLFFGKTDRAPLAICRNGEMRSLGRLIAEDKEAFHAICGGFYKTYAASGGICE